jgi:predicted metal-dependent hydrolase
LLTPTIKQYAKIMGVEPKSIGYKWVTSKWGHCTRSNEIMINTQLVGFEKRISDSVIVHELAHIKEHNHSTKFWDIVEKFCHDYKQCDEVLKTYSVNI